MILAAKGTGQKVRSQIKSYLLQSVNFNAHSQGIDSESPGRRYMIFTPPRKQSADSNAPS